MGASVTNALSEWLEVEIYRDGKIHRQRYEYWVDESGKEHVGEPVTGLEVIGTDPQDRNESDASNRTGAYSRHASIQFETLSERLQEIAFLNSGLKVTLQDERIDKEVMYPIRRRCEAVCRIYQ